MPASRGSSDRTHVTLATWTDRVPARHVVPEDAERIPSDDHWTDEWTNREETLHTRDGTSHLHVVAEKTTDSSRDNATEIAEILGADVNVERDGAETTVTG
ncbi:hypothetical protein VB773_18670 [Haloarculaceae archaeon H-GB2-1]|nr:hypothetical protein [Haloarculaceae archaeon H-GB1-1]MEA5409394.1 hypothetical protein [Haloarculaceae archaeon H-GB2-1]